MSESGDTTDYLMYDYNNACGFIAVAPEPIIMSSLTVSSSEESLAPPYSILENRYFEAAYPVYLTFLTSGDYEYGGTFYFKISAPFKWIG